MAIDIYVQCARLFATWLRIKILMGFIVAWSIVQMSLSAWMTTSYGGDFANIVTYNSSIPIASYKGWSTSICEASPYIYIEPFSFTYTYNGIDYSNAAYCGFPRSNSVLRIFTCVLTMIVLVTLFFDTIFSAVARTMQMILICLFFSSFVLDADAVATGQASCDAHFVNTHLYDDLKAVGVTLTCNLSDYAGVTVINLMLTILMLLLQAAWSHCTDLYSGVPGAQAGRV